MFEVGDKVIDALRPSRGEGIVTHKDEEYLTVTFSGSKSKVRYSLQTSFLQKITKKEPKVSFTKEEICKALKSALDHWDVECIYDMKGNLNVEFLAGLEIELDKL